MTNYYCVTEDIKTYSTKEAYIYFVMTSTSDFKTHYTDTPVSSDISKHTLLNILNSTCSNTIHIDTVKTAIKKFIKDGFISVSSTYNGKTHNRYGLYKNEYRFIMLSDELLKNKELSIDAKGFLIKLKCCCFNFTNECQYNNTQLADILNMSRPTINKYKKECEKYLKKTKQGFEIDSRFFVELEKSEFQIIKEIYPEILTDDDYLTKKIN